MASPSIRGVTAPVSGGAATSPAATQVGDLVVVLTWERAGAGIPTHTLQEGFNEIRSHGHDDGSTDGRLSAAYRVASQAGAQSYQAYTTSGGTTWWTGILVLQRGTFDATAPAPAHNSATLTTNGLPNPPSINLSNTRDYLVAAIAGWHLGSSLTLTPTGPNGYALQWHLAGAALGDVALATRAVTGASAEDPGTFGDDQAPNGSASMTIGFINPAPRTATLTVTLGALTASGTGTVAIDADLAATLGALTLEATGTVEGGSAITGSLDETLGALTLTGTASVDGQATLSATLGAVTLASTGTVAVDASLDATLGALTLTGAAAGVDVQGALAATLSAVTGTGTGTVATAATLAATLGALTISSEATVAVTGQTDAMLGAATLDATAAVGEHVQGALDATLGALTSTGAATVEVQGALTATLDAVTLTATGTVDLVATLAATLGGLTLTATGIIGEDDPPRPMHPPSARLGTRERSSRALARARAGVGRVLALPRRSGALVNHWLARRVMPRRRR